MKHVIFMFDEYNCPFCEFYLLMRRLLYSMYRNIFVVDCDSGDARTSIFKPLGLSAITPFYIIFEKELRMKVEDWKMVDFTITESKDEVGNFIFFKRLSELMGV